MFAECLVTVGAFLGDGGGADRDIVPAIRAGSGLFGDKSNHSTKERKDAKDKPEKCPAKHHCDPSRNEDEAENKI